MIRKLLFAATLLASTAHAAPPHDPRLASRLYRPDEVVRVDGRMGVQASIVFADDEHIENVAVGDSESWQITPNKRANLLFVKPLAANARTNMTVVTDQHTYFFDLIAASLVDGTDVKISGFGNFQIRTKAPRPGRNPRTGEAIPIQARRVVTFHASHKLKEQLQDAV